MAGFDHPGQTEYVGSFFGHSDPAMAFFSERLNVLLVTVHIGLKEVFEELTMERMVAKSKLFCLALKKLGTAHPHIAFCGLNPHASENGLFGDEEEDLIAPALAKLNGDLGRGTFLGPYPADTIFLKALNGEFDGVVAHYHDQGLIPLKLVAFDSAVNTTLGLPVVRVSPDHGTAFDIAGKGIADPGSMMAAIRCGIALI
jgi:4-hydroxythreonine-4-phosphate dehydrogenase